MATAKRTTRTKTKKTPIVPVSAGKLALLDRQADLLARLDVALQTKDITAIYFIQLEIMMLFQVHGESGPVSGAVAVELMKTIKDMIAQAGPKVNPILSALKSMMED